MVTCIQAKIYIYNVIFVGFKICYFAEYKSVNLVGYRGLILKCSNVQGINIISNYV